jgi:hypothetical protein
VIDSPSPIDRGVSNTASVFMWARCGGSGSRHRDEADSVSRFRTLQDWLDFCQQEDAEPDFTDRAPLDAQFEELQQAVRLLMTVIDQHEDGQALANLWLSRFGGGRWRLVPVIGKRRRATQ